MRNALLALLVLCAACASREKSEEKTVLEPVARLTELVDLPPDATRRCAAGDEFRPALGCSPTIRIATSTVAAPEAASVRTPVRIPLSLRSHRVLLEATARGRRETRSTVLLVEPGTGELSMDVAMPDGDLGKGLKIGVDAFPVPPPQQKYRTAEVEVPERAVLTVGLANAAPLASVVVSPVEFELIATAGEERWALFTETLGSAESESGWRDRRIDLAALAGRKVAFELRSTAQATDAPSFPLWGSPEILAPQARRNARNLLVISLDTVRADHVNARREGVQLTPRLDELAAEGTVFREAIAPYNATTASHMTLFTGVYPVLHEVVHPVMRLPDSITTLAETLARRGFQTSAVTENAMISVTSGFARGFDYYRENRDVVTLASAVEDTVQQGIDWLLGHRDERFFLFLHTYAAHSPYVPPREFLGMMPEPSDEGRSKKDLRMEKIRRKYAAEVRYADATFARLFAEMERLGVLSDTLIVVTSDHGEELGEHGRLGHAKTVYDEVTRVPLLFWGPGLVPAGVQVDAQVSLVDVLPTILELLEIEAPGDLHGVSLVGAMNGKADGLGAARFAEGRSEGQPAKRFVTARTRDHKWILRDGEAEPFAVFDLRSDPEEQKPLDDPALRAEGMRLLASYEALGARKYDGKSDGQQPLDEDMQQKLEALGYVD